ncbi:Multidrug export protein EmrB [compost metagenome]
MEHITLGDGPTAQVVQSLQATGLSLQQALAQVDRMVNQQAFMLAANDIFWASSVLFLLLIPLVWLAKGPKGHGGGGADAAAAAH